VGELINQLKKRNPRSGNSQGDEIKKQYTLIIGDLEEDCNGKSEN